MTTIWTDATLAAWQAELDATGWPDWRRDHHAMMRRQNCPTYRERRARLRAEVKHLCLDQIRKARIVPGWLTEAGMARMRDEIAVRRRQHSALAGIN